MKPLICPQCGGKITQYSLWETFATCGYCGTRFLIEREQNKPEFQAQTIYEPPQTSGTNPNVFIGIVIAVFLGFGALVLLGILMTVPKREPKIVYPVYPTPYRTPTPRISPTPTPNPNLLEFGGKGTGEGLFKDADSIAVDSKGRIYVSDDTLRVQQFDEKGQFLKLWQIPSETQFYKRARSIQKIAIDAENRLHVLVGGVVFVYDETSSEPKKAVYFSPDAILDFAFRSDGGRLYVVTDDQIETLYHINDKGKTVRKIIGFHTEAADAALDPPPTALAAIRLAVDGAGNIYSLYAFGDLGSYQLSYNPEELQIFRFTPEGKYVNKFLETMKSCGIEVDNQSRIFISDQNSINVYTNNGKHFSSIYPLKGVDAFTLDKQNNVYVLYDDTIIKRPASQPVYE